MPLTHFSIIPTILLFFVRTTFADGCYGKGYKFTDIVDSKNITDTVVNFCHDYHGGARYGENDVVRGCVDTQKGKKQMNLNITIEFSSILDESKAVNFTADACEHVLFEVASQCDRGGEGISVNYRPDKASRRRKIRDEPDSGEDQGDPGQDVQSGDAGDTPITTLTSITTSALTLTSTVLAQPLETPETSFIFSTAGTNNGITTTTTTETDTILTTQTIQFTGATDTTIATRTTSSTSCEPDFRTHLISIDGCIPSTSSSTSTSSSMNTAFVAKVKIDPNGCGCGGC